MPAVFVTGTGTDIGKTYVSLGLIAHWRGEGRKVAALKPVASGFDPTAAAASDSALLLRGLGRDVDAASLAEISPWRFVAPLSPDMAARREKRHIDFADLVARCRASMAASDDILLIEGIGGLMVPLDSRATVLDLIAELAVPILLVAGTYLGTLSHVLTACAAARQRGVEIRALVLNQSPDCAIPIAETEATLTQFCAPVPIISLARGETAENRARFARLAVLCEAPASISSGSVI
jgi:dethiobiotin synthetase